MSDERYEPPSAPEMHRLQNGPEALRLLVAQRRMYSVAKRWQGLRWLGLVILGIAAPFVSILSPSAAVAAGALAGAWLFVGRTLLTWLQTRQMTRAACVQEDFDLLVFQMPRTIERQSHPSDEDTSLWAGTDDDGKIRQTATKNKLVDWYDFGTSTGGRAVATAQRANASYTDRLIRVTVGVWATAAVLWLTLLIAWSALTGVKLGDFLLGVAFPVLPSVLDAAEYVLSTWRAARDRADLARAIERHLAQPGPVEGQDLLVWQERLFELRRTTPQVPDWLYQLTRRRNESAMRSAARRLS